MQWGPLRLVTIHLYTNNQIRREGEHLRHTAAEVVGAEEHPQQVAGAVSAPGELR